jgi:hypothetical protein
VFQAGHGAIPGVSRHPAAASNRKITVGCCYQYDIWIALFYVPNRSKFNPFWRVHTMLERIGASCVGRCNTEITIFIGERTDTWMP